eukprot:g24452.t1
MKRVFVYTAQGDVQSSILKTIGFDQSLIFSNHRGDLDWLIGLMVEDNGGGLGCCKAIVKRELIFLPLFGFSWWSADFICINRNWQADRRRLDAGHALQFAVHVKNPSAKASWRESEDTFTSWLMGRWQAKDARIARYQKDQQFMDATGAPAQRHLLSVDPRCAQTTYCAMLWWLLSSLFFFQHCVRYGRYRLLLGTGLGTLLLVALIGVVIQRVHFTHSAQGKKAK